MINSIILQLLNHTNIRMVEGMKTVSEQNAEATKRMAELAEVNQRQAQSMAALAYDTKRDSEVMKAITVVTLIFLPGTFVSVCPTQCLESFTYPDFLFRHYSVWASSILIKASSRYPLKPGFISLAPCRSPFSSSEHRLHGYGGQERGK